MSVDEKNLTPYVKKRLADYRKNVPAHVMASKNYPDNLKPLFLALIAGNHVRAMEIYFVDVLGATRVVGLMPGNQAYAYKFPPPMTPDVAIETLSEMRASWDEWMKAQIEFFSLMEKCTEIYNNIQHSPRDTHYIERARDELRSEKDTFARIERNPDTAHVWETYRLPLYMKTIAALSQQIETVKQDERVALAKAFRAEITDEIKKAYNAFDGFKQKSKSDQSEQPRPPAPEPASTGSPGETNTSAPSQNSQSENEPESFCDAAMRQLEWTRTAVSLDSRGRKQTAWKWGWPTVEQLFEQLEKAFDPSFYMTGVGSMTGTANEIQQQRDEVVMTMQRKAAAALWKCGAELADRYAEILRTVEKPAGLPKVERRDVFLEEFDRLKKQSDRPARHRQPVPPEQYKPGKTLFLEKDEWTIIAPLAYGEYQTPASHQEHTSAPDRPSSAIAGHIEG